MYDTLNNITRKKRRSQHRSRPTITAHHSKKTSISHCETQYEMPTNVQATLAGRNQDSYENKALVVKSPIPYPHRTDIVNKLIVKKQELRAKNVKWRIPHERGPAPPLQPCRQSPASPVATGNRRRHRPPQDSTSGTALEATVSTGSWKSQFLDKEKVRHKILV